MSTSAEELNARFIEIKRPLDRDEALQEANRCLFCYDAPCTRACPTHIDVPGFIKKIATGNLRGSARTILEANILGMSCARVCPTEELCEGACVLHDLHKKPIDIGRLQRYATDPVVLDGAQIFEKGETNGRKVAIVGAGPAGLGCAAELAQLGYECTLFEAAEKPGGLNTYGVADYKMDHETGLAEIGWIEQLGVEVKLGVEVAADGGVTPASLVADYDAVFLGVGLGACGTIGLDNEAQAVDALDFIAELKTRPKTEVALDGQRVAVIGGGNTAIDGVTQSARLGADKVYLVYRRGREQMSAYDHEVELALQDRVELVFWAQPVAVVIGDDGQVTGLRCQRTRAGDGGRLEMIDGAFFVLDVTRVMLATGQAKRRDFFGLWEGVELDGAGRVVTREGFQTTHDKIWAGGDCVNGGKEVVNAVAHGKEAARHIHQTLEGK